MVESLVAQQLLMLGEGQLHDKQADKPRRADL